MNGHRSHRLPPLPVDNARGCPRPIRDANSLNPQVTGSVVSDLARAVGRKRSQVSRMLHALEGGGLVEQDPDTRRYRLGWELLVLAAGAGDAALLRAARPALRRAVARTGEVALLSVQRGRRSLTSGGRRADIDYR